MNRWYEIKRSSKVRNSAEVFLYNDIGLLGVTSEKFIQDLQAIGPVDQIDVRINSLGGAIFEAIAIYNALRRHQAKIIIHVDGIAASSAADIAMAGDEIRIASNAMLMIHNTWMQTAGNAAALEQDVALLKKIDEQLVDIFTQRHGNREQVITWLNAETWFTSTEAKAAGFVDVIDSSTASSVSSEARNQYRQYVMNRAGMKQPASRARQLGLGQIESAACPRNRHTHAINSDRRRALLGASSFGRMMLREEDEKARLAGRHAS